MKIQRFLVENLHFNHDKIILKEKNLLNQIVNVFRFKKTSQFIVLTEAEQNFY